MGLLTALPEMSILVTLLHLAPVTHVAIMSPSFPADPSPSETSALKEPLTDEAMLVSTLASRFLTGYLRKCYRNFDGDLIMALVFGEICLRNIGRVLRPLAAQQDKAPEQWQAFLERMKREPITPCNALSISEATGIPRETVRRKVKKLEEMGWLVREGADKLVVTHKPIIELHDFSLEVVEELMDSSREIKGVMDTIQKRR